MCEIYLQDKEKQIYSCFCAGEVREKFNEMKTKAIGC